MSITLSPTGGPAGTSISASGTGFAASASGSLFFDINRNNTLDVGEPVQYLLTTAYGSFTTALAVPSIPAGSYQVLAGFPVGAVQTSATFTITTTLATGLSLTLSPTSGPSGTTISVTGSGFTANTSGGLFFDINRNGTPDTGEPVEYINTTPYGTFSTALTAPPLTSGTYQILAGFPINSVQATATFTISSLLTGGLRLSPASGPAGTSVTVIGSGFPSTGFVGVIFDVNRNGIYDAGEAVQNVTPSTSGSFSITLIVPSSATGTYPIIAVYTGQATQISTTFTVTTQ